MALNDNMYSSSYIYSYDADLDGANKLDTDISNLIANNKKDSIVSIYMFPKYFADNVRKDITFEYEDETHFNNNKMYTFPYNYFVIDTMNDAKIYMRERFDDPYHCTIRLQGTIVGNPQIITMPMNYNGSSKSGYDNTPNPLETVVSNNYPQCSARIDAFKDYLISQGANDILSFAGEIGGATMSFASGNVVGGTLGMVGAANSVVSSILGATKGSKGRGAIGSSVETACGIKGIYYKYMGLTSNHAQIVDRFFDRYGYAENSIHIPDISNRPLWNYVKTKDAQIGGEMPQEARRKIAEMFNKGITFWKPIEPIFFGNYNRGDKNKAQYYENLPQS